MPSVRKKITFKRKKKITFKKISDGLPADSLARARLDSWKAYPRLQVLSLLQGQTSGW